MYLKRFALNLIHVVIKKRMINDDLQTGMKTIVRTPELVQRQSKEAADVLMKTTHTGVTSHVRPH